MHTPEKSVVPNGEGNLFWSDLPRAGFISLALSSAGSGLVPTKYLARPASTIHFFGVSLPLQCPSQISGRWTPEVLWRKHLGMFRTLASFLKKTFGGLHYLQFPHRLPSFPDNVVQMVFSHTMQGFATGTTSNPSHCMCWLFCVRAALHAPRLYSFKFQEST